MFWFDSVWLFVCCMLIYFANDIYEFLSAPLVDRLPEGATMIATDVASPFFTPLKLTLISAVFVAVPFILYQMWAFVAPGLYKHEKRLIMPLRSRLRLRNSYRSHSQNLPQYILLYNGFTINRTNICTI